MDCKVFVIVDFDNFFPRPIPEIPINKIEFLFKEIVRDIITNVHNVQNIIIRIDIYILQCTKLKIGCLICKYRIFL